MVDLIHPYNRYPEWLSLQLEAIPCGSQEYELFFTLLCQEQWQDFLGGRIKWGIKGGCLQMRSQNSEFFPVLDIPDNPFYITIQNNAPKTTWLFSLKTAQATFQGSLAALKLGTVKFLATPFRCHFSFSLSPVDLSITDAESLWKHDISPNKHGILERKIAQSLYLSQLQNFVSGVQLTSPETPLEPLNIEPRPDILDDLKTIIEKVYQSPSNDLFTLAKLAHLDPLKDFAGGSFLGMELSGVQLGNSNLYHINLRGANLTDADLSEANLSYAKLSGADLSGAYLGEANLSYANLHRASLALSNLIGANLEGANLEEANLTNANLSRARLVNANFRDNPGMSAELLESLGDRGAKLVE
jgi:uncharacterized protein YjbI with pentapeptide repeats